jgi:hypothetical protein
VDDGGDRFRGQVLEHISQRFDQGIVQSIALGRTAQTDHSNRPLHVQSDTVGSCTFEDRVAVVGHRKGFQQYRPKGQKGYY